MDIAFWVFVYIAAAVQAALLSLALWRRSANREANRLLAVWVALAGIDLAMKAAYWHTLSPEWFRAYRFVALFPFLYGSLFFLYVRALTRGQGFRWRDVRHLLGFAAMVLATGDVLLASTARLQAMSASWIAGERSIGHWFDFALFVYSLSYVAAALVQVHRYRRYLRERRSDADRLSLRWIDTMAACQVVIWCIAIVQALVQLPILNYGLLFGAIAGWICVVGWFSLGQPPLAVEPEAEPADDETIAPATISEPDDARYDAVQARLAALMESAAPLYLEPALTIGQVAKRSGYPEYLVSAVINRRFGGTFWDYINRLRVEASRACLADAADTRSILDIAYACGFTSKSTFNAAFKRQVGDTPSSYRKTAAPLKAAADDAGHR
ncbi:helix-turn-helix transcriptional regulator [Rhodanobacter sp. DHG33]|uniref:helix-turn-helix domain-containing protein n=1 Tax=Rhodanobacter sp. DHG33 TaxID=2775921 RepID=UPI001783C447|nr:helix-turn-helix transcriptional regulator [Rhodanobacter sp. DHG33]MBD8898006.1 helix-turn-helix transcriptional regulator [Rhodanobacter sp. DHG33]